MATSAPGPCPGSVDLILTDPPYAWSISKLYRDLPHCADRWLGDEGWLAVMCGQIHFPEMVAALTSGPRRYRKAEWGPHAKRFRSAATSWLGPLAWDRKAAKAGRRTIVFVSEVSDVFDNKRPTNGAPTCGR